MEFEQSVDIEKPIAEVAELLSDPDHLYRWHRDLVSIERVSGEPGATGSKAVLNYDNKGRKFRIEETIIEQGLPRRSVAIYEAAGMKHTLTTSLEPTGDATSRITVHNHVELSGMAKLAGPMVAGTLRKETDKRVANLKRWLETGSADPA